METLIFVGAMLLGVAYRLYIKWSESVKAKTVFELKLALVTAGGSILANIILILFRDEVSAILPLTYLTACIYGYFGDSALKGIAKKFEPKVK